jgi:autotransporter-associated beta strand protein
MGIEINDYTAARNGRFASGYPNGPLVPNTDPSFIGLGYDWSGVGWNAANDNLNYALITPRQMLVANHYSPLKTSGPNIQFVSNTGQLTNVTVESEPGTHGDPPYPSDMATAQFSSPIPQSAGLTTYSILFLGYTPSNYVGLNLLSDGMTAAIGWNKINAVNTGTVLFDGFGPNYVPDNAYYMQYGCDSTTPDRTQLISGDSGSPSFIVTGSPGVMYLAGAHFAAATFSDGSTYGYDTFLPMSLPTLDSYAAPAGYLPSVVTPTTARWTGGLSGSGSWNTGGNWSGGSVPNDVLNSGGSVTTCASVLFDGLAGPQHAITLGGTQAVTSLAFNLTPTTSSGFTFSGGTLTLGEAGLTNNDVHVQTFTDALVLRTSEQWQVGSGGVNISAAGSLSLGSSQLLYLNGSGTSDFEGLVSGTGSGIAKDGSGTLILGNTANTFSGQIFVHNGTLQFTSIQPVGAGSSALGAPTSGTAGTIYLAGTLVYVGGGNTSDRVIDVADGPGAVGATGVIDASGTGPLALTGRVVCENYNNSYSGATTLVLQGAGSGSQSGVISSNGGNVLSLVKTGSGGWNLSGSNTYNGTTTVNTGLLTLSGSGAINQSTALTVGGGTVQLDDSAQAANFSSSRLGSQPISLQGGVLSVNLGSVTGGTETFGLVTAAMGENTLALAAAGGSGWISGGSLARQSGATLNFIGALSGSSGMALSGMPSGSNFIDAGTFVNGADYAVYDAAGYVRAMVAGPGASDYATYIQANRHVLLTSTSASLPSLALLTLSLSGGASGFSLSSNATLTLTDGGILKTGGGTAVVSGGAAISTTGEYVLRADTAADQLVINTPLGGGTALTKSGLGTLLLGAAGNSYGGVTTIDAGTLKTGVAGAIPATSPLVIASGGSLDLGGQPQTVAGITLYDGSVMNSAAATTLTLGGSAAGVTYAGVGFGSTISGGTLNLAGSASPSGSHTFNVARGQGSVDLNVLANIANGSTSGQTLVKTGNGILQLSGANTYSGGTQIDAGTLALGSNRALPATGSLALYGGTLNLGSFANTTSSLLLQSGLITGSGSLSATSFNLQGGMLAASLVGSGSLSMTGSGAATISSSNSYSGGTTLSGGTLTVSAVNNLGAGPLVLDGGMLQVLGTSFTSTSALPSVNTTANGGGIYLADPNNSFTLAANLAGSGPFTKAGQGSLLLGGSLASTAITVEDGSLQLTAGAGQLMGSPALTLWNVASFSFNHNESVSSINLTGGTINSGNGTLNLAGSVSYAQSIWPATIAGNLALGASAGTFSITQGDSTDLTVMANISGSPTSGLVKQGDGLLTLSGTNSYSGGTTIDAGNVVFTSSNSLPSGGILINEPGALDATGSYLTASGWLSSGLINPNSTGVVALSGNSSLSITMTGYSSLSLGAVPGGATYRGTLTPAGSTYRLGGGGGILTVTSNLTGANNLVVGSGGPGTVVLAGGSDTYSGTTTITAGTLQVGTGNSITTWGAGPVSVSLGGVLNFDVGNTLTVAGAISGEFGRVTLSGTGTIIYTGSNTYAYDTFINGGTLQVGNGGGSGTPGLNDVFNSGTLSFSRSDTDTVPIAVVLSGALVQLGPGTLVLTANNTYSGPTTISGGTLQVGNGGSGASIGSTSGVTLSNGSALVFNHSDNEIFAPGISGNGNLLQMGSGDLTLTGSNTYMGATTISSGTLQLGNGSIAGTLGTGPLTDNGTLAFNLPANSTFSGVIGGSGGLAQMGSANMILTASNTYTGATTVSGGALQIGTGGTGASIGSTSGVTLGNNAAIVLDHSDNVTFSSVIGGTGSLTQMGSGVLTLTASDSYVGTTTIGGGTLQVGNGGALGTGLVLDNAALVFSGSGTHNLSDPISGSGSLTKSGSGTLILSGSNTYGGGTTITSGTLEILGTGGVPDGGLVIAAGGTFIYDPAATLSSPVVGESGDLLASDGSGASSPFSAAGGADTLSESSPSASNAVPEPDSLLLLCAAAGAALLWRLRRKPRGRVGRNKRSAVPA